jgi:uncharacterized protein (TIGR01370 family)
MFLLGIHLACAERYYIRWTTSAARPDLHSVRQFALIYRHVPLPRLAPFDLIILEGSVYSEEEIRSLASGGRIVLAYLNIGEIEAYRPYARFVEPSMVIAPNPSWPDHQYIRPGHRKWRKILMQHAVIPLLQKGVHGFFLDSVDLASPALYPEFRDDMARLISYLRSRLPDAYLIANNATFLLEKVGRAVDGLLIEEVFFTIGPDGRPEPRNPESIRKQLIQLKKVQNRWNLPIFLVDYVPPSWEARCFDMEETSRRYGFLHFCTDRKISQIYPVYSIGLSKSIR